MWMLNAENFAQFIIDTLTCETIVVSSLEYVTNVAKIATRFMNKKLFMRITGVI